MANVSYVLLWFVVTVKSAVILKMFLIAYEGHVMNLMALKRKEKGLHIMREREIKNIPLSSLYKPQVMA